MRVAGIGQRRWPFRFSASQRAGLSLPFAPFILERFAAALCIPGDPMSVRTTIPWKELATPSQVEDLLGVARRRRWGLSLILVGWLHLLAFGLCYDLTIVRDYHQPAGYLAVWISELLGMGLIFRLCGGPRPAEPPPQPLERLMMRVWISYFLLVFNLGTLNTLRGHRMFEFFPATASLASFAFLVMTFVLSRRFFVAVLVMFGSGLLMAAYLLHAYLIFALAWWLVLNGIGLRLWRSGSMVAARGSSTAAPSVAAFPQRTGPAGFTSPAPTERSTAP